MHNAFLDLAKGYTYMNKILYASVILLATTSIVSAADLNSNKPSAPKFNQLPMATWTGFYAGVNLGYSQTTLKNKDAGSNESNKQKGPLAGITLGYNYEFANRMVLGVEGDYAWSGMKKTGRETTVFLGGREESESKFKTSSLGTLRARAGYSFGSFMPYVTGGLAVITSSVKGTDTFFPAGGGAPFSDTVSARSTKVGYALGAGAEAMITSNISFKAEYIYAGFGASNYNFSGTGGSGTVKLSNSVHVGRVGLNYRF
jgi:outer membrane immunogenic protein